MAMMARAITQPRRPVNRDQFEIAVICALPLEADAVEILFDHHWDDAGPPYDKTAGDTNAYSTGAIGRHNVVLAHMPGLGKASAATVAVNCRNSFPNIRLALVVGVCGVVPFGLSTEERVLGDVIISDGVIQYDFGRKYPEGFSRKDTLLDSLGRPNAEIRGFMAKLKGLRGKKQLQDNMVRYLAVIQNEPALNASYPGASHDRLFEAKYRHINDEKLCDDCGCNGPLVPRQRLEQETPQPAVHFGLIASGDTVLKSGEDRDRHARQTNVIGFEMESAGVWDNFACVVIKGACDYADSHKTKAWQRYAAATAAACMKAFLDVWVPFSPAIPHQPVGPWFVVPYPRNDKFVCRDAALETLRQPQKASSQKRTALFGLGGIGKTQIALDYAYWFQEAHPDMSVFWVHGGNEARFRQSFDSIAKECRIPGYDDPQADALRLVKDWLERKEHSGWLMVIDNADDAEVLFQPSMTSNATLSQNLGHYIPECAHGTILATTRNKQAGVKLAKGEPLIEVGAMDENESRELLHARLGTQKMTPQQLANLSARLEHLPLALVQAAAFIEENSLEINDYIQLLDEGDQTVIERLNEEFETTGRDTNTPRAVVATWILSFEQIQRQAPFAGELLSLMSFWDRQAIPREFLSDFAKRRPGAEGQGVGPFLKALGVLKAFSLVTEAKSEGLDMHRLVQLVTRKWLADKGTVSHFASQALFTVSNCYRYGGDLNNWAQCRAQLAHALAVLKLDRSWSQNENKARATLMHSIGGLKSHEGSWKESEELRTKARQIRSEVLGIDHPDTLNSTADLALTYWNQGRWDAAEKLETEVLEIRKQKLGANHPSTVMSMANLATTYRFQGRWDEAEKLEVYVMEIRKQKLGADHPSTMIGMANLASTYRYKGRWDEAEKLEVKVMEMSKQKLGADHPSTLTSMTNLASTYWNQGRWNEAEKLSVEVIEISKQKLGADHPDTLVSMLNLASTYSDQGRSDAAEKLKVEVIGISEQKLGADHHFTLTSKANLASTYRDQGRLHAAEKLEVEVIKARKQKLGADHPYTLSSISCLAATYWNQSRWNEAEKLFVEVMESQKQKLGADHPDTLTSMDNLASTWERQCRYIEAIGLMQDCVERRLVVLGIDHPKYTSTYNLLNDWISEHGDSSLGNI